jgi:AcrR family transcriptional regulator
MTAEERDGRRRERLVETAIELMGTRGAADTTVTAVCTESGVTSRYFYQHFADRDALLRAVSDRLGTVLYDVIVQAIPKTSSTPETLTHAPIHALVELIQHDRRLARILFVESGTEPILRRLRSEIMTGLAGLMLQQARLHLNISDSAVEATQLAATLGVGGLFEVLRRWLDGEFACGTEMLVEHCAGMLGSLAEYVLRHDATA